MTHKHQRRWKLYAAVGPLIALLSACGGEGSTSLSGAVIDGYIRGAIVCVDINSNLQCDAGEPTGTTGAGGQYTINTSIDVTGYNIVAEVPVGAVDEAEGPITAGYNPGAC